MRAILKCVALVIATILALPFLLTYVAGSLVMGRGRAFQNVFQCLSLFPGISGQYLRRAFLMRTLASFHPTVTIEIGALLSRRAARLDKNVYIGPQCHIGWVHIGEDTLLAAGVHVPSGPDTHGIEDAEKPIREQEGNLREIRIGAGCWIGSNAVVLADIGDGTVVAAGAVVTKPLPARVIAGGVPARVIRERVPGTTAKDNQ